MSPNSSPPRRVLASSPFPPPARVPTADEFVTVGALVTHDRLGLGRVVQIGVDQVVVDFGRQGKLLRSVSHLTLTPL